MALPQRLSHVMFHDCLSDTDLDKIAKKWKTFTIAEEAYNYIIRASQCMQENSTCQCLQTHPRQHSTKVNLKKITIGSLAYKKTKQVLSYVIRNARNYQITEEGLLQSYQSIDSCFIHKVQTIAASDVVLLYLVLPSNFQETIEGNSIACLRQLHTNQKDKNELNMDPFSFHYIVGFTEAVFKTSIDNKECVVCVLSVSSKHPFYLANSFNYSCHKRDFEKGQCLLNIPYSIEWNASKTTCVFNTLKLLMKEMSRKNKDTENHVSVLYDILYLINPVTMTWGIPFDATSTKTPKETMYLFDEAHLNAIRNQFYSSVDTKKIAESCLIAGAPGSGKTCLMIAQLLDILKNPVCVRVIVRNAYQARQFVSAWKTYSKTSQNLQCVFVSPFHDFCDTDKTQLLEIFSQMNQMLTALERCLTQNSVRADAWKTISDVNLSDTVQHTKLISECSDVEKFVACFQKHFDSQLNVVFKNCTGIPCDETTSRTLLTKWMKTFEHVTWSLTLPNQGTFCATQHSSLILLWLAGVYLSQTVSSYLNKSTISDCDINDLKHGASSSCSTVCLREWPLSLLLGIKALKTLLLLIKKNSKRFLLPQHYAHHRFLVIPLCDTPKETLPLVNDSLENATHVFIDDAEHIPFLTLFLLLIWIDKIQLQRKRLYVEKKETLQLWILTALSTAFHTAKTLKPFRENWDIVYLPLSYTLSASYLASIQPAHQLLGISCVASDQKRQTIPISVECQNTHFKDSQDIYLITTACIVPPFAIRRRQFKGTLFIEGAIAQALITNLDKQVQPNECLEIFVMSLCDIEMQLIVPLMRKSYKRTSVEFGTPESFLGKRCDITILLCFCTGAVSCGSVLNDMENVSYWKNGSTLPSCAEDSLSYYNCPYNLPESDHRMRLALTRSRYSTYIVGQLPSLFKRHYQYYFFHDIVQLVNPFACLRSSLSFDYLKKSIQMFLSSNLSLAFQFTTNHITFECVGSILQKSSETKPISMLNQLTNAFGMPSRLKETIDWIHKERCIITQVVYESVQYINTHLNSVPLSPPQNKQCSTLFKQCTILNKLLLETLDWNVSIIFFFSSYNEKEILHAFKSTQKKNFLHFIPFFISTQFQYTQIFNYPELFPMFHFHDKNKIKNNKSPPLYTSQKLVLIFHCTRYNLIHGGLQILNELCLLATFMEGKKRVFLLNCFTEMHPWYQQSGLKQIKILNYQIDCFLLLLALSVETHMNMLLVNFEDKTSIELQKFLFMLGLINADQFLLDSNDIYLLCNLFIGSKLLLKIQKYGERSLKQSEHNISQREDEMFKEPIHEKVLQNNLNGKPKPTFTKSDSRQTFQGRKNRKLLQDLLDQDKSRGQATLMKCFPSYENVYGSLIPAVPMGVCPKLSLAEFMNNKHCVFSEVKSNSIVSHNIRFEKFFKSRNSSPSIPMILDTSSKNSESKCKSGSQSNDCLSILTSDSHNSILDFLKATRLDDHSQVPNEKCSQQKAVTTKNNTSVNPTSTCELPSSPVHKNSFLPRWRVKALQGHQVDLDAFAQRNSLQKKLCKKSIPPSRLSPTVKTSNKTFDTSTFDL